MLQWLSGLDCLAWYVCHASTCTQLPRTPCHRLHVNQQAGCGISRQEYTIGLHGLCDADLWLGSQGCAASVQMPQAQWG